MRLIFSSFIIPTLLVFQLQAQDKSRLEWGLEKCIAYAKENNIQISTLRL